MNSLLFQVQQFFIPVVAFWPIWLLFIVIWLVLIKLFPQSIAVRNWSKVGMFLTIILILVIRGLYFAVQPYQQQFFESYEKSYSSRIYVRNGQLIVRSSPGNEKWQVESYSPKNMNRFEVEEFINTELNRESIGTILHFNENLAMNILSQRWHIEEVLVPTDFEKQLHIIIQDGVAEIDLAESNVTDLRLKGFESKVIVKIPSNQKKYKVSLVGRKSPVKLVISRNSDISIIETYTTFNVTPEGFVQASYNKWHREGNNGQIIDIEVSLGRNGLALEYTD